VGPDHGDHPRQRGGAHRGREGAVLPGQRQRGGAAAAVAGLGETWAWHWSAFATGSLLLQTLVGAFASYLAWMWLLVHYPATKVSAFVFLTPIFALVFGALWLREPITPSLVLALALVAAGIVLVNRRQPAAGALKSLLAKAARRPML
jgi:drug/metabolite transporter (DMT)-like permease